MPKTGAAEWLLSLFTTPDRASAIVGDLSEQQCASWFNILRTATALFAQNAAAEPLRISIIVLLGVTSRQVAIYIATLPWGFLGGRGLGYAVWASMWTCLLAPALIGYVIARLARGRELTACLVLAVIHSPLCGLFAYRTLEFIKMRSSLPVSIWDLLGFVFIVILFNTLIPVSVGLYAAGLTRKRAWT